MSKENSYASGYFDSNEKRFRALIENAYEGIVVYDSEAKIKYASPSVKNFGGYQEDELLGMNGISFIHPDEHELTLSNFQSVREKPNNSVTFRQRLKLKNGEFKWCETTLTNLLHDKEVQGIVSNFRDISKRKKAEDELKNSKLLLESINYNINEAIYRNIPGKKFEYVNKAFLTLFGYESLPDLNKKAPSTLYADKKARKHIKETLDNNDRITNYEVQFVKKNGEKFWGLLSSSVTKNKDGKIIFDGAIRDITSEKKAREQLRESEQLLSSINLNIKEGIYRSSFKHGLQYINDAFIEMFGYENREEVLNTSIYEFYNDSDQRESIIGHLRRIGSIRNEEVLFKRKDGSTFWGLMSSYVVKDDNVEYFDGAIRDISDIKKVEEQLLTLNKELRKQNEALETREDALNVAMKELSDRNFELDQLVYKTSHDIRSPLTSILGLVNIAKQDNSPENKEEYLSKIEKSILKLDEFVKSMLNYAKSSRADVEMEKLQIEELLKGCINDLEYLENFEKVNVSINIKNSAHPFSSDPLRLKIIFSNIISNAYKYLDKEKDENRLDIKGILKKSGLKILFHDNGIGINKNHLSKIFDMFYRATEKSEGSGLGMYIVKQSIDKLGGTIEIKSKEGEGTEIEVFIPTYEDQIK